MKHFYSLVCAAVLVMGSAMAQPTTGISVAPAPTNIVNATVVYEATLPRLEMPVDNAYTPFSLEFDMGAVTAALGVAPTPGDFCLVLGAEYSKDYTANNGFWLNKEGENVGWGDNSVYFVEYHEGNSVSIGQMPGKCQAGDEYSTKVAFVTGGKAAVLTLNIGVVAAPEIDYQEVFAAPITADVVINQTGVVAFDQQAIEVALGCAIDQAKLVACNTDGKYVTDMTANFGFWYDKEGNVSGWGEGCSVFVEHYADKPAELTIGMFAGLAVGDSYTVKFGFANEDKAAIFTITVNIVAAPEIELQEVYATELVISLPLNSEYIPTPLAFDREAIEGALGCTMAEARVASVDAEGKYVTTTTANNGFWYNKAGYPSNYGDNSSLFVEYQGEATLNVGMFPEGIAAGDEYTVKFGFYYSDKVAMLTIKATIADSASIESISVDAVNGTIYNLHGVAVDPNNLPAGIYIANGKKFIVR